MPADTYVGITLPMEGSRFVTANAMIRSTSARESLSG
jgi:hypothetical protein